MTKRLSVDELAHAALSLRPVAEKNFQVESCGLVIGEIIARRRSFGRVVWFWSLSGPHLPEGMSGAGSNAMSFEGAKTALKSNLDAWLQSQTGTRADIPWSRA